MTDIIYCDKYIIKIVSGKESDVSTTICHYCFFLILVPLYVLHITCMHLGTFQEMLEQNTSKTHRSRTFTIFLRFQYHLLL